MENFVPENHRLQEVFLHYFSLKKNATEAHRILMVSMLFQKQHVEIGFNDSKVMILI